MSKNNWDLIPLSKLSSRIGDGIHGTPKYIEKSPFYFVNGNNLKNGQIQITEDTKCVDEFEYNKYFLEFNQNTLFLSINGTLGSLAKYRNEKIILGKSAAYINCNSIDIDFLYYYLRLDFVQENLYKVATGSTIKNLSLDSLRNLLIPCPKLSIQKKIAAVLSALDAKIELNNRINAELESLAKTIYDYWFVQFDFPFDFAQGKPSADGKPYKSSGGEMVYVKEGKGDRAIPAGWEIGTLYDLANIAGGSTPSTANPLNFCKNGTAWITPKDLSLNMGNKFISKGELDVTEAGMKDASLKIFPKDTILLSSRAPIGYMAISRNDVTTNQGFKSFIPNKGFSTPFVYYAIKNSMQSIVQYASGSTFKEISLTSIKSIQVCLPDHIVVDLYTEKVKPIFRQQDILEQENQQLTQLRDWLLPMLMNGQVSIK